jgi:hypothetical protein
MAVALSQPPPPDTHLPTYPQLSSLGKVGGHLQAHYQGKQQVSLLDIEVVMDQITPSIMLYQWSSGGRFFIVSGPGFSSKYRHARQCQQFENGF